MNKFYIVAYSEYILENDVNKEIICFDEIIESSKNYFNEDLYDIDYYDLTEFVKEYVSNQISKYTNSKVEFLETHVYTIHDTFNEINF
ncbi:hypothetical protein [Romboutsia lituseburensis]|uniref:hypothetical protein n=1 Tax=Romboutsia lituseburensis TaxID=1537 RepID=UPI0022EB9AD0|nr:hypothetical protein [Romboutsia lituseburensis]